LVTEALRRDLDLLMRLKRTIFIASAGVVTAALIAAAHAETLKPNNSYWIPPARHSLPPPLSRSDVDAVINFGEHWRENEELIGNGAVADWQRHLPLYRGNSTTLFLLYACGFGTTGEPR
jgi:hypothetical protein